MSKAQSVEVIGGERCVVTLDAASKRLRDLGDPASKASTVIATDARMRAPKATGALAASVTPAAEGNTARVVVGVRYGWPVESGVRSPFPGHQPARPFLANAREATQPIWTTFYEGQVLEVMGTVKGV